MGSSTMKVAFVLVLLVALVSSQQIERLLIDNFAVGANQQSVEVTLTATISTSDPPQSGEASFSSAGCGDELLGCGRDMQMLVTSGLAQRDFKSDIFVSEVPQFPQFVGEWSVQNPKTSSSVCTLQYDGIDNSFNLNINGLGGIDITDGGLSTDFVFTVTTDLEITYTIELHDTTGSVCRADLFVPVTPQNYDIDDIAVDISLNSFSGCDKTSIGAIQFLLPSDDAVDAIVRRVSIIGDPDPAHQPQLEQELLLQLLLKHLLKHQPELQVDLLNVLSSVLAQFSLVTWFTTLMTMISCFTIKPINFNSKT